MQAPTTAHRHTRAGSNSHVREVCEMRQGMQLLIPQPAVTVQCQPAERHAPQVCQQRCDRQRSETRLQRDMLQRNTRPSQLTAQTVTVLITSTTVAVITAAAAAAIAADTPAARHVAAAANSCNARPLGCLRCLPKLHMLRHSNHEASSAATANNLWA